MGHMFRFYIVFGLKKMMNSLNPLGKKIISKVIKILSPKLKEEVKIMTLSRIKLFIQPLTDNGIERRLFNNGVYEEGTLWCLSKILKKNQIFVDVGANIGLISLFASKIVGANGRVLSFEPMTNTFDLLMRNINLNKVDNVVIEKIALSDIIGEKKLFKNLHINRGAASFFKGKGTTDDYEMVKVDTLDNYFLKNNVSTIDMIKIDAEGAELHILKGMSNLLKFSLPIICLEYSTDVTSDINPEEIYKFLTEEYGYIVFKQRQGKESYSSLIEVKSINDLPQHDNLYFFQEKHINNVSEDLFC